MEEIAEVYGRSLFEVAAEHSKLAEIHEQLVALVEAFNANRSLTQFFFSPYFTVEEKKQGLERMIDGADPIFMNFLQALIERSRMPAIFRIRAVYEHYYDESRHLLPVQLTSAVALDDELIQSLGKRIGEQTGKEVELSSKVDPSIIGGIVLRVGNFILDASIHSRLEDLRREVAQG